MCEGTLEYQITIDYILNHFSKVKTDKMKPVIREILRSSVYQLKYMDSVPDSAVCNEAVKLAQKKGFYNLKPFVNGVLRTIAREMEEVPYPERSDLENHLSVKYSMPPFLVQKWLREYGEEITEKMLADFLTERPTTVRCRQYLTNQEETLESIREQGILVSPAPYLDYAFYLSGYNHILTIQAFLEGKIQVQDVSSMLVAEVAAPKKGDQILDLCAAPGGKSLHVADKMAGFGMVEARRSDRVQSGVDSGEYRKSWGDQCPDTLYGCHGFGYRLGRLGRHRLGGCSVLRLRSHRKETRYQIQSHAI